MGDQTNIAATAVDLYRMAGQDLTEADEQALAEMLAVDAEGLWVERTYYVQPPGMAALDARALAGLFLLAENVVWSTAKASAAREAFRRLRNLIDAMPGGAEHVRRFSAVNGGQRIVMQDGRWLAFVIGINGGRGYSCDCWITENALADPYDDRMMLAHHSGAGRPNPQVIATAWSSLG